MIWEGYTITHLRLYGYAALRCAALHALHLRCCIAACAALRLDGCRCWPLRSWETWGTVGSWIDGSLHLKSILDPSTCLHVGGGICLTFAFSSHSISQDNTGEGREPQKGLGSC